jgi:hypothetical protein
MVDLLKSLGGDVVVPSEFAESHRFKALISDMPKPSLAVAYASNLDDPALAKKVVGCFVFFDVFLKPRMFSICSFR